MPNKRNDNSSYFSEWTTKKLKECYQNYKQVTLQAGYSSNDVNNAIGIEIELTNRGYNI